MNLLWLQSAGCGGCTMSLLCAEDPNVLELLEDAGIDLLWHPAISEATGAEAVAILNAVEKDKQHVFVGTDAKVLAAAKRVAPASTLAFVAWAMPKLPEGE